MTEFFNKVGVRYSFYTTIVSLSFLLISLIGLNIELEEFASFTLLATVIQFFYGLVVVFSIIKNKLKYNHLLPFLILNWFIGCFATNIFINIFHNLPFWVYIFTFLFCISFFVIYNKINHRYFTIISYFVSGLTLLLIIYFAVYLIPYLHISLLGILALGLGFYGLVPLLVLIIFVITFYKINPSKKLVFSFISGILFSTILIVLTTYFIENEIEKINAQSVSKSFDNQEGIPTYIKVSQHSNNNFFAEIVLKKGLVYTATDNFFSFDNFRLFSDTQYNERKVHHPLYNIAYYFSRELDISREDQVKILQSNFDKRLETEEQLWSGEQLSTKNIKEDVQIFPETRLAYSEFTIDVTCENIWGQQEGIYSFQLPEGSVATSLSLWVNGIERKGVLTTKEKAQKAYTQIVGVEARDPSLMQWREGNRVVVRVFPISKDLPRTFKCGFTTPLKVIENQLIYENISIRGPKTNNSEVLTRLQINNNQNFESNKSFELKNGFNISNSSGLENWNVNLKLKPLQNNNQFVWKNKIYETKPLIFENIHFQPSEIILDLNNLWTKDEIHELLKTKNKLYYYQNNSKKEIDNDNYINVLNLFNDLQYSLLPFYNMKEKSLIVTKSNQFSANFEELKNSEYLLKVKHLCKSKNIKIINISENINPFWQTMKEQNLISFSQLNLEKTIEKIKNNKFTIPKKAENCVNIENAQISIFENDIIAKNSTNSNDHIYRMYAFGKVMSEHINQVSDTTTTNKYVNLAQDANIVTPITSLIVLETDEDYQTHGIEKNVNSLGNASVKNEGAVPEPHEWMLIIISLIAVWYFYFRKKQVEIC